MQQTLPFEETENRAATGEDLWPLSDGTIRKWKFTHLFALKTGFRSSSAKAQKARDCSPLTRYTDISPKVLVKILHQHDTFPAVRVKMKDSLDEFRALR